MTNKKVDKENKERDLEKINLLNEVLQNQDLTKLFDSDNENNLDIAFSLGILFTLDNFKRSKRIKKRLLRSMSFLKQTTEIDNEVIMELQNDMVNVDGKSRKEYMDIIKILSNANTKRKELRNENRLNRFFNR